MRRPVARLHLALLLGAGLVAASPVASPAPRVVVTVGPIHSLVAGVTAGVTRPTLLLEGGASPHVHALRPSRMRALQDADLVIWVGEHLETFLARPLEESEQGRQVLEVTRIPEVEVLAPHDGDDGPHEHDHGAHERGDPHVWLDPDNATAIASAVAARLADMDPANAERYRSNASALNARIAALDVELARLLDPVRGVPFAVFHDAYRYFERHYGLQDVGAVTISPDRAPGAGRLSSLRQSIVRSGARCVFAEPQFEPRMVHTIIEGTGARAGVLDPLGAAIEPGPDAWFTMMRGLAHALVECLATR